MGYELSGKEGRGQRAEKQFKIIQPWNNIIGKDEMNKLKCMDDILLNLQYVQ